VAKAKKKSRLEPGLPISFKKVETYFFFLAAFFLGAAFFLAAFFLVAIFLEFNVSKNGLTIVKITIILYYPNFFSTKFFRTAFSDQTAKWIMRRLRSQKRRFCCLFLS
jgi:hypothetical protein